MLHDDVSDDAAWTESDPGGRMLKWPKVANQSRIEHTTVRIKQKTNYLAHQNTKLMKRVGFKQVTGNNQ